MGVPALVEHHLSQKQDRPEQLEAHFRSRSSRAIEATYGDWNWKM